MTDSPLFWIAAMICGFTALTAGLVGGTYLFNKHYGCPHFAAAVQRPYKFDFIAGGCFVQTIQGQWVHERNYWNNVPQR